MDTAKASREEILQALVKSLSQEGKVKLLNGINPCLIDFNGTLYYFYCKNLTPAQLSNGNPNVWRIQLPKRKEFDKIKRSSKPFVVLGYDKANKVFVTWNPFWCRQRLNVGESISLYSRLSAQEESAKTNKILEVNLNKNGLAIVMPANLLPQYLAQVRTFFPNETEYKAIGSSLRKSKIASMETFDFASFANAGNLQSFKDYMLNIARNRKGNRYDRSTVSNYSAALLFVYENNLMEKYKGLFDKVSTFAELDEATKKFAKTDEIAKQDIAWHNAIHAALGQYLKFYRYKFLGEPIEVKQSEMFDNPQSEDIVSEDLDHNKPKLDSELISKLRPLMIKSDPDIGEALAILSDYYGDKYNDVMKFEDWINLLNNYNWSAKPKQYKKIKGQQKKDKPRAQNTNIRITYSDGRIVENDSATQTYIDFVLENFPDLISEIDFGNLTVPVISDRPVGDGSRQRKIDDNWYLLINLATKDKIKIMQKIAEEFGLDVKIEPFVSEDR